MNHRPALCPSLRLFILSLTLAGWLTAPSHAADEDCKHQMSERISACAHDCRDRALGNTKIEDPNNNVLFLCIKTCAQQMALQNQVCR